MPAIVYYFYNFVSRGLTLKDTVQIQLFVKVQAIKQIKVDLLMQRGFKEYWSLVCSAPPSVPQPGALPVNIAGNQYSMG